MNTPSILSTRQMHYVVSEANLAPSVHNTQPARWKFEGDSLQLYAHLESCLKIGDPEFRDAGLSCGAALEGMVMALSAQGYHVSNLTDMWAENQQTLAGYRIAVEFKISESTPTEPALRSEIKKRFTWRGTFEKASSLTPLLSWSEEQDDITLITGQSSIDELAGLNDIASLKFFKDRAYREELLSYMRLSKKHPLWHQDGLNCEAMHLSAFEGMAAKIVLRHPAFEIATKLGLGKTLVSEAAKTKTASAVALFTCANGASPIDIGRAFYRRWLEVTQLGFAAWPMAVLADDAEINTMCCDRYKVNPKRRLVNVLRLGPLPEGVHVPPARLAAHALILNPSVNKNGK